MVEICAQMLCNSMGILAHCCALPILFFHSCTTIMQAASFLVCLVTKIILDRFQLIHPFGNHMLIQYAASPVMAQDQSRSFEGLRIYQGLLEVSRPRLAHRKLHDRS